MSIASQTVSDSDFRHDDPSAKFSLVEKDQLYNVIAQLREIKRIVGGLDVDEDGLEQVWRIVDTVQTKILELTESE
jgi:hypothetical protein